MKDHCHNVFDILDSGITCNLFLFFFFKDYFSTFTLHSDPSCSVIHLYNSCSILVSQHKPAACYSPGMEKPLEECASNNRKTRMGSMKSGRRWIAEIACEMLQKQDIYEGAKICVCVCGSCGGLFSKESRRDSLMSNTFCSRLSC